MSSSGTCAPSSMVCRLGRVPPITRRSNPNTPSRTRDPASITNHRARLVDSMFAMKWTAQCMEEVFQKHPTFTTFVYGTFATQMSRGMTPIQRTKALVHLTDIVCRMDKKTVMSTLLLLTYRYVQPAEWVSFLHFVSKVIFRVYMVGRGRPREHWNWRGPFGVYCQSFFSSVKHINPESPISPATGHHLCGAAGFAGQHLHMGHWEKQLDDFYQKIRSPQDRYHGGTWTRFLLYHWEMHVSSDAASVASVDHRHAHLERLSSKLNT